MLLRERLERRNQCARAALNAQAHQVPGSVALPAGHGAQVDEVVRAQTAHKAGSRRWQMCHEGHGLKSSAVQKARARRLMNRAPHGMDQWKKGKGVWQEDTLNHKRRF